MECPQNHILQSNTLIWSRFLEKLLHVHKHSEQIHHPKGAARAAPEVLLLDFFENYIFRRNLDHMPQSCFPTSTFKSLKNSVFRLRNASCCIFLEKLVENHGKCSATNANPWKSSNGLKTFKLVVFQNGPILAGKIIPHPVALF